MYAALAIVHPKPQAAAARGNCRPAISKEMTAEVWCSVKLAWERCAQLNANAGGRGADGVSRGFMWNGLLERGRGAEKERHKHTFRILLCLLRGSVGVGIVNASWLAVLARVLGVGEVEDEGGGCGEDYVAGDLLVFCYVEEVIAGMGSSWRRAA